MDLWFDAELQYLASSLSATHRLAGGRGTPILPRSPMKPLRRERRNVAVLAALQALLLTNTATAIALAGLVGYALAPNKALATLPVTGGVVGAALTTLPMSLLMRRLGRKGGFTVGIVAGWLGAAICCYALDAGDFALFVLGSTVLGVYNASGQYHRFAAADAVGPDLRAKAISYVLAGGLIGGVVGPTVSRWTKDALPTAFLGAYLALMTILTIAFVVVRFLDLPPTSEDESRERRRPLLAIVGQPAFVVSVVCAAFGYGVMNLLMTATPLAMGLCGHDYGDAANVIAWHIIGMFAPSFFTGALISRFGVLTVMLGGVLLNASTLGIALAGVDVAHFWLSLFVLGVGWNFLFIGATTLLTETYRPNEKARAQGANDALIFLTMAISSLSSGVLLESNGWQALNFLAIPFVAAMGAAVLWLMRHRRVPVLA